MSHPNPSTALARVVIDQLVAAGVSLFIISPGSRSAALAIAAGDHPDVRSRVVIDERSAGFHALGSARASGRPAAVISTSGSAVANFFPAVVEADTACVPLVVITADRPAELQGVGANQTIDQIEIFGPKVRAYAGIEAPDAHTDRNREWRETVASVTAAATGPTPGPVQINLRFREPTVPVTHDGRTAGEVYPHDTSRLDSRMDRRALQSQHELPSLSGTRGLVVAGDGEYDRAALGEVARDLGWPVLATAQSGMRDQDVVSTYHHILARGVPDELRPETVVAVGATGPSPRLDDLISSASTRVRIDRWGRSIDPRRDATHRLTGDVVDLLASVRDAGDRDWPARWARAERDRRRANDEIFATTPVMTGPGVAATLDRVEWDAMVVASSLPIRDVDAHLRRGGLVFSNRGASGIDGFVSTALGVAGERRRVLALTGDLSLLHDANGFLHDDVIDATFVVVDNGGGGLFDGLPQASHAPDYERLFVTDPKRDLSLLADFHGLRYTEATDRATLVRSAGEAMGRGGVDLIRVPVDRKEDRAIRDQLDG